MKIEAQLGTPYRQQPEEPQHGDLYYRSTDDGTVLLYVLVDHNDELGDHGDKAWSVVRLGDSYRYIHRETSSEAASWNELSRLPVGSTVTLTVKE